MEPASTNEGTLLDRFLSKFLLDFGILLHSHPRITALRSMCMLASVIMWMMMPFFTDQWKFTYTYAAGIRNVWSGLIITLPAVLVHVADAFMGDFYMSSAGSLFFSIGLGLLAGAIPSTSCNTGHDPAECSGKAAVFLYVGLALTVLGLAAVEASLSNFDSEDEEISRHNMYNNYEAKELIIALAFGILQVLMYFNKIRSWRTRFLIASVFLGFQSVLFVIGKGSYSADTGLPKAPNKSLVVTILRVFVASTSKLFYRHPGSEYLYKGKGRNGDQLISEKPLTATSGLKWLDKAAMSLYTPALEAEEKNCWRLCTVTEVEKTKMVLHILPLWGTFLVLGVVSSIGDTYFLEQANNLEHKLGRLSVPLVALLACQKLSGWAFGKMYEKSTKCMGMENKVLRASLAVAMAMVFAVLCCIVAAKMEMKRLGIVLGHNLTGKDEQIPMSIFWLVPQFMFLGGLDTLFEQGNNGFSNRFPRSMVRFMVVSAIGITGLGRIGGVLSIYLVGKVNHLKDRPSWFQDTINESRLDNYYWFLAKLSAINLGAYILISCWYLYRESSRPEVSEGGDCKVTSLVEFTKPRI